MGMTGTLRGHPLPDRRRAPTGMMQAKGVTMVEIHITGVHFQVSDKVRGYISEKLGGLSKFHGGLKRLNVTIHPQEKHGYKVDVDMHLPHGQDVVAHDSQETIYSAIDMVSDKAAAQLRKIHQRETERNRQSDRHLV